MIVATSSSVQEQLRLVKMPSRSLRAREARVRVRAIGVNPVDWKMREGGPLGTAQRILGPSGPLVVGIDFAGEVIETGVWAHGLEVGDRVVGGTDFSRDQWGSYASEVIVRPDQCAKLPDSVSFEEAACLPVAGVTALRWLVDTGIPSKRDPRVLVLGASGGVGLFAVQLARKFGAAVVGVCSTRNAPLVSRLGATVIDYTAGDPLAAAAAHGPFDLVLNTMGSAAYDSARCHGLLTPEGVLGLVVVRPADYPALLLDARTKTLLGKPTRETLEVLVDALAKREIEAIIDSKLPLAEAEVAHVRSRGGKAVGKILLIPEG